MEAPTGCPPQLEYKNPIRMLITLWFCKYVSPSSVNYNEKSSPAASM